MCNTLTGKCACLGMWTGPTCDRAIGDFSVPTAASSWYQPPLGVTWEWQIDGEGRKQLAMSVFAGGVDAPNCLLRLEGRYTLVLGIFDLPRPK